jgi:hypothetical protein
MSILPTAQYVGLGEAGRLIHFPCSLPPSQLPAALPPPRPWRRYGPPAPGGSLSLLRRLTYSYRTQPVGAPALIAGLRTGAIGYLATAFGLILCPCR